METKLAGKCALVHFSKISKSPEELDDLSWSISMEYVVPFWSGL